MKCMGFQIVFNILKMKKHPANRLAKYILPTTWERGFEEMSLAESQMQLLYSI